MTIKDALQNRRTIRKFNQEKIDSDILIDLVNFARLAPTGMNMQPLKYAIITDDDVLNNIFPHTKWAGFLPDGAPKGNERPTAYIAILGDLAIRKDVQTEAGAAITTMLMGAMEYGLGSCWLGAIDRHEIMTILQIAEDHYNLLYLVALGYPKQESEACETTTGNYRYWQDEKGKIYVPKRSIQEVIVLQK